MFVLHDGCFGVRVFSERFSPRHTDIYLSFICLLPLGLCPGVVTHKINHILWPGNAVGRVPYLRCSAGVRGLYWSTHSGRGWGGCSSRFSAATAASIRDDGLMMLKRCEGTVGRRRQRRDTDINNIDFHCVIFSSR